MYFFHPIQQCAQQVYHTALPLSPTSSLQKYYLPNFADDQPSHVIAFIGAPSTWGLLLRTIDTRPMELTSIATSGQQIIAACGDIVKIYDAVTGVLKQSLSPSKPVTKIQASTDGSTLFFAHSSSVTMWDVQTGGLIHTFTTQSVINNIAVSTSESHIACGSSDGSVAFWNIRTKGEGRGFGNGQPVVTICWLSPQKLAVATRNSLYIRDIAAGKTVDSLLIPGCVWGMLYFGEEGKFLVGTSPPDVLKNGESCSLETISSRYPGLALGESQPTVVRRKLYRGRQSMTLPGRLAHPTLVGKKIACINLPMGVQLFDASSYDWNKNPPLLDMAESVAVSLNRNLVAQTKDSIQIFSTDVLTSGEARSDQRVSHIYPLGESYIICVLQPTRHLAILELETLHRGLIHHDDQTLPFGWLLTNELRTPQFLFFRGVNTNLHIPVAMRAWRLGNPLPEEIKAVDRDTPRLLHRLSPTCTRIAIIIINPPWRELWINDAKRGGVLALLVLRDSGLGEACDLIFDSETRFYLEIEGPQNIIIPYEITTSPPGSHYPYTITEGEAIDPSEFRKRLPYTLDTNCEWVLDTQSRKICWISPANLRRGDGGHFWIGSSLFMVGDDGVVRKVSFREPDC